MFSKKHRLAKDRDIKKTLSSGRSFFNSFFSVRFVKRVSPGSRFTVVVSTKVSKKAVVRNRIKRVAREFIRNHLEDFPAGDYVVMAKVPAAAGDSKALITKLIEVLPKSKNTHV